jgi:folate-dependent tRNA-U54 methylase TrmFO/GidA
MASKSEQSIFGLGASSSQGNLVRIIPTNRNQNIERIRSMNFNVFLESLFF